MKTSQTKKHSTRDPNKQNRIAIHRVKTQESEENILHTAEDKYM